jgi:hypothetical protein
MKIGTLSLGFFMSKMTKRYVLAGILIIGGLFFFSCTEEKKGVVDAPLNSPRLVLASLQPTSVHLDTGTTNVEHLTESTYRVTIAVSAQAIDPDGGSTISSLALTIYSPRTTNPLTSGILQASSVSGDTAWYSANVSFVLSRADAGINGIEVTAIDKSKLTSSSIRLSLAVERNNSRPTIFSPFAPDTVIRPTTGSQPVLIAVSASDSDGIGDIVSVYFKSPQSSFPNTEFPLFDDGDILAHGDSVAGDGRYSFIFQLSQPQPPIDTTETREFRFWARDIVGALSDSLSRFITIVPE